MAEASITYSLKFQARALAAVQSDKLQSKWVVGTNALREENEIRVLQYDADQERVACIKTLTHTPEIWDIATSAESPDLLLTVHSQGGTYGATLWSMQSGTAVQRIADLPGHEGIIRGVLWHTKQTDLAVTVEEGLLHKWTISDQGVTLAGQGRAGELLQLWSGALHAQNASLCATAGGNNVQVWDLRSMACTGEVSSAHRMPVRDVCFSPCNEHRLVSSGDDCKLRVWDVRVLGRAEPLLELGGHSHWVWRAQFSPFYEQLIASSSSDSLVNLYHTPYLAASSAAEAGGAQGAQERVPAGSVGAGGELDGKAASYDEHEDSVYGLAWSNADPWLFASLSYDGRVVVNKVPKGIKYKLLI